MCWGDCAKNTAIKVKCPAVYRSSEKPGSPALRCSEVTLQPAGHHPRPTPFPLAHEFSSRLLLNDSHLLSPQLHSSETLQISSLATYSCLFSKSKDTFPVPISAACQEPPGALCVSEPGNQRLHTGSEPQSTQCLTLKALFAL